MNYYFFLDDDTSLVKKVVSFNVKSIERFNSNIELINKYLKENLELNKKIVICLSTINVNNFIEILNVPYLLTDIFNIKENSVNIVKYDLTLNPHLTERFKFREATFTRSINSHGDRVYSRMLQFPIDYEEIVDNANIMKKNSNLILVQEPFLLDDELREKVTKWVEWANKADPSEYDPFASSK